MPYQRLGYKRKRGDRLEIDEVDGILRPFYLFLVYVAYATILFAGYVREAFSQLFFFLKIRTNPLKAPPGYAPLFKQLEYFWLNRVYQRIRDVFERPVCGVPGSNIFSYEKNNQG